MASSIGVFLYYRTTVGSGPWTQIANIADGETPTAQKNVYEQKNLDQADRWIRKGGAFVNPGQAKFTLDYTEIVYGLLLTHVSDENPIDFKIELPLQAGQSTKGQVVFAGHVMEVGLPFKDDGGRMLINVTFDASGPLQYTTGS